MYNLEYGGKKLNKKPLTEVEANNQISEIVMNYGYKPMKILEKDGYKYSREKFEGHKFRTMYRLSVSEDWREDVTIHIYTDNPNQEVVDEVIFGLRNEKVISVKRIHWTTKEQDELINKLLEEEL